MGFECGFSTVKKYKDTTLEEFNNISSYLYWKKEIKDLVISNDDKGKWSTYEDFWKYSCFDEEKLEYPGEPDQEKVEYYDTHRQGEYNSIAEDIHYWCSSGRYIDDFCLNSIKHNVMDDYRLPVTKEWIQEALEWVDSKLDENELMPVKICRSFKEVYKDSYDEDPDIVLTSCDGVEVETEDGEIRRLFTNNEDYYDTIFISKNKYFDPDAYSVYKQFKDTLNTISHINLYENIVYYWRSY